MHITLKPYYITIIDAEGGIRMGDNTKFPVSHRVFVDKQAVMGVDSLRKLFNYDIQALTRFISRAMESPSGTEGRLSWEHK